MTGAGHSRRATRALRKLAEDDPTLAALALWCRHRDGPEMAALASSDGTTVTYGPRFEVLTLTEQIGLCAHHVLHIALRHSDRADGLADRLGDRFDRDVFNIATDALINETLLLAEFALPRPCLVASELLQSQAGERIAPEQAVSSFDAERLYLRLLRDGPGGGGNPRPSDADSAHRARIAEIRDHAATRGYAPDLERSGTAAAAGPSGEPQTDWDQHLARALEAGRQAGRGLGVVGHRMADLPRLRTLWEQHLRGLLTRAILPGLRRVGHRPARRWLAADSDAARSGHPRPGFEPGWTRQRRAPRIVVALDCSGSVDDGRLARFAGEIAGLSRRSGAEITLLTFDEQVRSVQDLGADGAEQAIRQTVFARGGGTDFGPALLEAARGGPSAIVVFTDLDGGFGPAPKGIPVIWAVTDPTPPMPPFGKVVTLTG